MHFSAGSQSFNSVNTLRVLGRWLRMFTIPNQSSVAKAYEEFDEAGRMKPSAYYDRIVDVMEELVRFTVLLRPHADQLVDRYSERVGADRPVARLNAGTFAAIGPVTVRTRCKPGWLLRPPIRRTTSCTTRHLQRASARVVLLWNHNDWPF